MCPYNDVFKDNKKLTKYEYYGHSIVLIESICEAENKHCPQTFKNFFFEKHNSVLSLFKELVNIIDFSDGESEN